MIDARQEKQTEELKLQITMLSVQAEQIFEGMVTIWSDKNSKPQRRQIWDYYPKLFEKEREAYEIQRQKEEMALYQAKFNDFVLRHNRKFGGDDPA